MAIIFVLLVIGIAVGAAVFGLMIFVLILAAVSRTALKIVAKLAPSAEMEERVARSDQRWIDLKAQLSRNRKK